MFLMFIHDACISTSFPINGYILFYFLDIHTIIYMCSYTDIMKIILR